MFSVGVVSTRTPAQAGAPARAPRPTILFWPVVGVHSFMSMLWSSEEGLALTNNEAPIHICPHGRCVACVAPSTVHFWALGTQPTLIAVCSLGAMQQGVSHICLAWHPGGRCVAIASGERIVFYSVARSTQHEEPYASPYALALCGFSTCISADRDGVLVGGGVSADTGANLALLSWDGIALRTFRMLMAGGSPRLDPLPPLSAPRSSTSSGALFSPGGTAPLPATLHRTPSMFSPRGASKPGTVVRRVEIAPAMGSAAAAAAVPAASSFEGARQILGTPRPTTATSVSAVCPASPSEMSSSRASGAALPPTAIMSLVTSQMGPTVVVIVLADLDRGTSGRAGTSSSGDGNCSGRAVLLRPSDGALLGAHEATVQTLHDGADAVCAAVSGSAQVVAIGLASGDVLLYSYRNCGDAGRSGATASAADSKVQAERLGPLASGLLLSLRPWGYDVMDTGCTSCLAFSSDGHSLAIGYARRGAAVFGSCGTLTAHWPVRSGALALAGGALARGTCSIAWEPGDMRVLAAAATSSSSSWPPHGCDSRGSPQKCTLAQRLDGDAAELTSPHLGASSSGVSGGGEALARGATEWCLWRLGMLQEPRAPGTVRPAGAGALLLLADDHVRVAPVQPSSGMQRCQWRILPVPRSYLNRGWPLRLAALSSGGARVAVAGVRGVAVATLATERWRYLGASAAQLTPFRALFLHWLSDEALLVVACATPSIEQPAMTAAPLTTADGADIAFAVGNTGGAAAAAAAAAAFAIRTHGGSTADGQRLSLMVLRSDLREVLFRTEIGGPSPPRAPLWGCAVLPVTPASGEGKGGEGLRKPSRYGMPDSATIVLGASCGLCVVELAIEPMRAEGEACAPLRFCTSVASTTSLPAEASASEPTGLGAAMADSAEGAPHASMIEAVVALADGTALVLNLPLGMPRRDGLRGTREANGEVMMNDDGARADQSSSMRTALDGPQVRHAMPPATAVRAWHSAGVLWTLNADGMREWRLSRPQRATPPRASAIPHPGIDVTDPSTVAVEDADDCADDSDAADPDAAASLAPIAVEPLHILPTPNECWPLTVLPGLRAVVGVASLPVPSASAPIGPHVHLQPIAHHHVRRRLIEGDTETAFQLARAAPFRRRYCLELLLHEALLEASKADARTRRLSASGGGVAARTNAAEEDGPADMAAPASSRGRAANGTSGRNGYLFVDVASLVRRLGPLDWCRIVSGCARKTDAVHWPRLFAACGHPSEILQAALDAGETHCAAALLLPVRHASGTSACEAAVNLVRSAAEARGIAALVRQLDAFQVRLAAEQEVEDASLGALSQLYT